MMGAQWKEILVWALFSILKEFTFQDNKEVTYETSLSTASFI